MTLRAAKNPKRWRQPSQFELVRYRARITSGATHAQCVREGVATPWFLVKDEEAVAGSPEASVFGDCEV